MTVTIDAKGLHPTTISCLEALQWLRSYTSWRHMLDMGCGTGILSLAAASLCHTAEHPVTVLAADISPQAIADTLANYRAHGLDHYGTAIRSDGFCDPLIKECSPYDLILCNLLAEPLIEWSGTLKAHLAPGGVCLLSGILAWLAPELEAAYRRLGFEIIYSVNRSPWVTHVMQLAKPSADGKVAIDG